jgi:predicted AAA+ superfamily ATPase
MRFVTRTIGKTVLEAARNLPAAVLTGPRRAGKTTLLRHLFPHARYVLLEDPEVQDRARGDPRGLLDELRPPVLFAEIQNVPELLAYVRTRIDQHPRRMGQWLFTGSQEASRMRGVSESMAGRAAILQLLALSLAESDRVSLLAGGFPEALARPAARGLWFSSYVQTYLERDVRSITNVRNLATFRRFLALVASRHGQVLNRTDLAAPLGVSVPTINDWLQILEVTGQIILVPPYFENFGKRLIKSPKVYLGDSGLACHLLGIRSPEELERSPFLGALFEGFVAAEILKSQVNAGRRKELYHFRDQQGLEVDFLVPGRDRELWMIECKAAKTVQPASAGPLLSLGRAMSPSAERLMVVHRASASAPSTHALAPGVEALDIRGFVDALAKEGFG